MRKILFVLVAAGLLAVAAPVSGAGPSLPPLPAEVEEALPAFAQATGVTTQQARRNIFARDAADPLIVKLDNDRSSFTGARFNKEDGSLTIFSKLPEQAARARLGSLPDISISFAQVPYGKADLVDAINAATPRVFAEFGGRVAYISAGIEQGKIIVATDGSLSVADLQPYFTLPVAIRVTGGEAPQACYDYDNCPQWRGGIELQKPQWSPFSTVGLWGIASNGSRVLITHGHNLNLGINVYHDGVLMGSISRNSLLEPAASCTATSCSSFSDSARIDVQDNREDEANNWVLKNSTNRTWPLTSRRDGYANGDSVCVIGIGGPAMNSQIPFLRCGDITDTYANAYRNIAGTSVYVQDLVVTDYSGYPGDSGGPVFGLTSSGNQWLGIHSGGANGSPYNFGVFSKAYNVEDNLNVTMCKVSNC